MQASTPDTPRPELTGLDDPEFLAERRRVRSLVECADAREAPPDLAERMRELDEEFIRRARLAWQEAS